MNNLRQEFESLKAELDERLQKFAEKLEEAEAEENNSKSIHIEAMQKGYEQLKTGATYYQVDEYGYVQAINFNSDNPYHNILIDRFKAFLSMDIAEIFSKRTSLMAQLFYFKSIYDEDFVPDWTNWNQRKYTITYDSNELQWTTTFLRCRDIPGVIYFSSESIAQKCCDWLTERGVTPNGI